MLICESSCRIQAFTGGFVWGKGKWKFMRKADYPTEANGYNMGLAAYKILFCPFLLPRLFSSQTP
jgi:hypothetical protein